MRFHGNVLIAVGLAGVLVACGSTMDTPVTSADLITTSDDCPAQLPHTGEPTGAAIDREQFGCYGACGASCNAPCVEDDVTVTHDLAPAADGTPRCQTCTYHLKTCKSHSFCRWHDDCYRQCDLRWDAQSASAPANPPWNPCYLSCDNVVAHSSLLCGADWSQVLAGSNPSIADVCWDGSIVAFSNLTAQNTATAACGETRDARPRPWAPDEGLWSSAATPPPTLPEGYSCSKDTDCPDRNQRCDIRAGTIWGINGPGLCVNTTPSPAVDVAPLAPPGLWQKNAELAVGSACTLGYECKSGACVNGLCAP